MRLLETVAVALLGGFLFHCARLPLPWLLGTITFLLVWKFALKRNIYGHKGFRPAALLIIGYNIGSSFTRETGSLLAWHLPYMFLTTLLMLGASALVMLVMRKVLKASKMTSMLSSVPGGMSAAVALAQEARTADLSVVVFSQTVRILAIVYTVPFLVVHVLGAEPLPVSVLNADAAETSGWQGLVLIALAALACIWGLKKARFPIPELLGTVAAVIILTFCGITPPAMPDAAIIAAQTLMGISLADGMKPGERHIWRKLAPLTLVTSLFIVAVGLGIAWLLAELTALDFVSAFLSVSAGGIAEMVLTGALVGANLPVIAAYQLFRILTVLIAIPPLARILMRREEAEESI